MNADSTFDIAIVGAGITGASLAAYLRQSRLKILLVEKDWREQDRIVGELLQPGGVEQLKAMQLEHCLEGFDAQAVSGYAVFKNNEHFTVEYPKDAAGNNLTGRGFHNGKFVEKIRAAARQGTNVTCVEGEVAGLEQTETHVTGIRVRLKNSDSEVLFTAALTVVSDGIFSVFRNQLCEIQKEVSGYFLGLVLKHCSLPFPNHGHVFAGGKTPFLAYPISSSETRMLIDFPGGEAPRKGALLNTYLQEQVRPFLPKMMYPSFDAAIQEGKFKVMPNHYLPAKPKYKAGVVIMGDALNMRHPLTGGGMTVAFSDVKRLGDLLLSIQESSVFTEANILAAVKNFYEQRSSSDATINILANALYKVFSHETLSQACFDYLKQGGKQAAQPVALLSAVSRKRSLLLRHFFAVAVQGAGGKVLQRPTVSNLKQSFGMFSDAVKIVSPLLVNEQPGRAEKMALWIGNKIFA